jgi:hypothetical protein
MTETKTPITHDQAMEPIMQALFETFMILVLAILAIIGVGGFLFLSLPQQTKRWLTEKYPPEDREP